jgi:hypothetical protein
MHNVSRCDEINKRFPGLIPAIINAHKVQASSKARNSTVRARKPAGATARVR